MAKLYRHKLKGWEIHYRLYLPDGRDKRKWRSYHTKLLAQTHLQNIEKLEHRTLYHTLTRDDLLFALRNRYLSRTEADQLMGAAVIIPTLGELAGEFLTRSEIECRQSSHGANKIRIRHLLNFFGEACLATEITMEEIVAYRQYRSNTKSGYPALLGKQGVTASTINKEIIKLAQLLDIALEKKALTENPARKIRRLRDTRERKPRSLTKDEIRKLLIAAKADKRQLRGMAYEIIMTYLYTGMRRKELVWLEWEDVDLDRRRITIQAKINKGAFVTKTGKARVVGIAVKLAEILAGLPDKGRYVFGNTAPLIKGDGITHAFRKLANAAGLPRTITIHSLRHTYITHLMEAGVNPRRVQELAGHSDMATTWRYAHALPSEGIAEDLLNF